MDKWDIRLGGFWAVGPFGAGVAGDFVAVLMRKINSSHTMCQSTTLVESDLASQSSNASSQDRILMLFSLVPMLSSLSVESMGMRPNIAHIH